MKANKWLTRSDLREIYLVAGLLLAGALLSAGCGTFRTTLTPDEIASLRLGQPGIGQPVPTVR
jgi:hypothetical protein